MLKNGLVLLLGLFVVGLGSFGRLGFFGFVRCDRIVELLEILGRIGLELIIAADAAILDLPTFMNKLVRFTHAAQFLVCDDAGLQRIRNHVGIQFSGDFRCFISSAAAGKQYARGNGAQGGCKFLKHGGEPVTPVGCIVKSYFPDEG